MPGRFEVPTLKHTSIGNAIIGTPAALKEGLPEYLGDLDNPIIPLYQRSNFPGWNYRVIEPSLRLASRLLDMPCLLGFPHAIFYGEVKDLPHPTIEDSTYLALFRRTSTLSAFDVANVRLRLHCLAEVTRFNLVPELDSGAMTSSEDSGYADSHLSLHLGVFEGWRISVVVDYHIYERLYNARDCRVFGQLSFFLSVLLCHEIMHAAYQAGDWKSGMPFEHNVATETVYEWESHIFGGLPSYGTLITDWPCAATVLVYRLKHWPLTAL